MRSPLESHTSEHAGTDKNVLTVSELNRQARITIEQRFSQVWVLGEMSNFARPRSGHWYFSLKDENAQVRCAMFANRNRGVSMQAGDGQLVIARGRVSLYEGRGDFQIIIDHLEPAGEGALRQAFDQLKVKLASEGLFSAERKQTLPRIPKHIAVVTSATGAAIKDVLAVWQRRYPTLKVTIVPSVVQGPAAEGQLLQAIDRAATLEPDVLLVTRGGGSLEDLWSFNLESVARALAACPCPTVSAIGHEIDVTICDFVADLRAPTPSAAAELLVPDAADLSRLFDHKARQLQMQWRRYHEYQALNVANLRLQLTSPEQVLERANQRVDDAAGRLTKALSHTLRYRKLQLTANARQLQALGPREQLHNAQQQMNGLQARLGYSLSQQLQRHQQRLTSISRMLHTVSPLPTIGRGFGLVTDKDGAAVTSTTQVTPGDTTTTYLQDGAVEAKVTRTLPGASIVIEEEAS